MRGSWNRWREGFQKDGMATESTEEHGKNLKHKSRMLRPLLKLEISPVEASVLVPGEKLGTHETVFHNQQVREQTLSCTGFG